MQEHVFISISRDDLQSIIIDSVNACLKYNSTDEKVRKGKDLLSIEEAAEFLNLSKPTLYRLVSERNIPFAKKGKRLYFSKERLTEWVESGEVRTQAQIKKEVNNG